MMWWKFMANVGINQTGAILGAPYGSFQHCRSCREAAISAMREVIALAPHYGVDLTENDLHMALEMVDGLDSEGKNSMVQDIEAGRKTEVATFAGQVCRMGAKAGVPTPVNRLYEQMLRTLEWQSERTR
jgi:2-dehydropantoate 2-reductase